MPRSPDNVVDQTYDKVVGQRDAASRRRHDAAGSGDHSGRWHGRLKLETLSRPSAAANPLGADFDYAAEFSTLDLDEVARDIDAVLTTSQDWWPADYGHYGPLMLRMAWHAAGTYRVADGRGGAAAGLQRFAPLNSWPDNINLDKARRLLWPVKQKYGPKLSWADLMVFAGNRALESMGFTTFGFAGGREEVWEADDTYWGPEDTWFADERHSGVRDLHEPLAASAMGLIYVDPQGPATLPDPITAARDIRQTFARMGFDDEETVALIAGGHTFGKSHGQSDPGKCLGREPEAAPIEASGLGWRSSHGCGHGHDTVTSGLEGIWTPTPTTWDNAFFETMYAYEWDVVLSPAGLWQWVPSDGAGADTVPDPHNAEKRHAPTMLTTDLSLQVDPIYGPISRRFLEHPDEFADAFARAWFKLTHVDLGPRHRYLGDQVPAEQLLWQDPLPDVDHPLIGADHIADLKEQILAAGLPIADLVRTAWASASTYRDTDKRGGANGARIRLEPQCTWEANEPARLGTVLAHLEQIRDQFNAASTPVRVSLADLIVLAGAAAIESAAAADGVTLAVPFRPGRVDATVEQTDPAWFAALEPRSDAFRNFHGRPRTAVTVTPEHLMVDRARQLKLTAPEMTVLVGGMRALGATHADSPAGVLTDRPGVLSNDFFVNLLDPALTWQPTAQPQGGAADYVAYLIDDRTESRTDGPAETQRWEATRVDVAFLDDPMLRNLSEYYATDSAGGIFVRDFVRAWDKVMTLDLPSSSEHTP